MLLVTGGADSSWELLASTEVYRPSAGEWREVTGGALPRPMEAIGVVTLNNRVLLFGQEFILTFNSMIIIHHFLSGGGNTIEGVEYDYVYDYDDYDQYGDILEYSDSGKWTRVGEMSKKRRNHAASIVDFDDFKNYCQ